jgi:hypothetical protein
MVGSAPKSSSMITRINWCGYDFSPRHPIRPLIALQIVGGLAAAGAAALGGYAYRQHQRQNNPEEEVGFYLILLIFAYLPSPKSQALSQAPQPDARERAEGFVHDNRDKLVGIRYFTSKFYHATHCPSDRRWPRSRCSSCWRLRLSSTPETQGW